jgi:ribonuclease P protein component
MSKGERQTFVKNERLCKIKLITEIFENGYNFHSQGFRVVWIFADGEMSYPAQVAFSIPRKNFRRAVTRNLIRRRIKEAYRKNKQTLYKFLSEQNVKIAFVLLYKANSIPDYITSEGYVKEALEKLCNNIGQVLGSKC